MKRFSIIIILILLLSGLSAGFTDRPLTHLNDAALVPPATNEFTFAVFGDFRASRRDRPYPPAFKQMLYEMNIIAPSFIISLGDVYYGYGGSFQRFKNEINHFLSTIKPLSVPFLNVIGNHEVVGDREREDYVKERFGRLYGSFDFGNSHFILLNTEEIGREGTISGEQLKWLERDLEANRDVENIFVFMHRPMFPQLDPELAKGKSFKDRENRDYLHRLFKKYRVAAVFTGHEHLFSDAVKDGVRYIITGGGGSPLYQSPSKGGFFHYLIVKVKGREVLMDILVPHSLQIRTIAGNDGFEPKAELEITNISSTDLHLRNLLFIMPRAEAGSYRVKALSISPRGHLKDHQAGIRQIKDNGDGTASVSVETELPKNSVIRGTVEVDN